MIKEYLGNKMELILPLLAIVGVLFSIACTAKFQDSEFADMVCGDSEESEADITNGEYAELLKGLADEAKDLRVSPGLERIKLVYVSGHEFLRSVSEGLDRDEALDRSALWGPGGEMLIALHAAFSDLGEEYEQLFTDAGCNFRSDGS